MSHSFIKTDPQILGGTPCFAGTRVPVKSFFDHLQLDYSIDEFLDQFPSVERVQVEQLLAELEGETVAFARNAGTCLHGQRYSISAEPDGASMFGTDHQRGK